MKPPPATSTPLTTEIIAPPSWQKVAFISDLHLQVDAPGTAQIWRRWMASLLTDSPNPPAAPATTVAPGEASAIDALFILGDLFEVWIGDDLVTDPQGDVAQFAAMCLQTIRAVSQRIPVFFMAGNRDFLLGEQASERAGMTRLDDPTTLHFGVHRYLLSHGDAWCLSDRPYMQFRAQVRSAEWQAAFLALPLAERQRQAKAMRDASHEHQTHQRDQGMPWADLDDEAVIAQLTAHGASSLIHGHTHRPGQHSLHNGLKRLVLSDWDTDLAPEDARAEVLLLSRDGHHARRSLVRPSTSEGLA